MRCALSLGCCAAALLVFLVMQPSSADETVEEKIKALNDKIKLMEVAAEESDRSRKTMGNTLARQMMLLQLAAEERVRSEGGSGFKQKRLGLVGRKPYYNDNHAGHGAIAIHDHSNFIKTVGMGQFVAIMNGVEFRTRHNDYELSMPSTTSSNYHEVEDIPFPDVPDSVKNEKNVTKAVEEMKEWFRAFLTQNDSVRDYKKYFKPILCYMEGHWMIPTDTLEDPFASSRHKIEAKTWAELQDKIRYTAANGAKSNLENFSYLPTAITNVTDGVPEIAQWTYRLLCHPLKTDVPLSRFQPVDDLVPRMTYGLTVEQLATRRAARFALKPQLNMSDPNVKAKSAHGFLDKLMKEVPGLDNYGGNITDITFGMVSYEVRDNPDESLKVLNAAFYNRGFEQSKVGAMGEAVRHRSFNDPYIFMAQTSNPRVPKICANFQGRDEVLGKWIKRTECQRWTYAVPMEIIYLTPLSNWNPYNLKYKGVWFGPTKTEEAVWVRMDGRNGVPNKETAYNGTNDRTFFHTPKELFDGPGVDDRSKADTSNRYVGVLGPDGEVYETGPTGIRVKFNIDGVGEFRQRWPVFDVPYQASSAGKEVEALKDILLGGTTGTYKKFYYNQTTP